MEKKIDNDRPLTDKDKIEIFDFFTSICKGEPCRYNGEDKYYALKPNMNKISIEIKYKFGDTVTHKYYSAAHSAMCAFNISDNMRKLLATYAVQNGLVFKEDTPDYLFCMKEKEQKEKDEMNYLVESLRNQRKRNHISQQQLAIKSGVSQEDISKIERGIIDPTLNTMCKLFTALDTSIIIAKEEEKNE